MRKIFLFTCAATVAACSSNHANPDPKEQISASAPQSVSASAPAKAAASQPHLIGGWAPVFFTSLDTNQLDSIASGITQQRIKRAVISYPTRMQTLALKIHDYLQQKTNTSIPMTSVELKDTDQVKYNLTQVIVTLYFN